MDWKPCGENFPGIECATARVPLDHDQPRGATTEIALARVPAADPAQRIGTVFVNPGGPGQSGVDLVLDGSAGFLALLLGGRFDVVGFDPRGVAASDPLRCFESEEQRADYFAAAPDFPYQHRQERPYFERYRALAGRCLLGARQAIARHMSTADVARDLDLLRQAVGDERLTYLGFSYGSFLGMTYANLFPNRIRALALDSMVDPRLWSSGKAIVSSRTGTAREFAEFLRLCDEAGDACALAAPGGASRRYDALVQALRRAPLTASDGTVYSHDLLILDSVSAMYAPESWTGYAALFAALAEAVQGNPDAVQEAFAIRESLLAAFTSALPRERYDNGREAFYGNHCADAEYPHGFEAFRAVGDFAASGSILGPHWWWFNAGCAAWPSSPDRHAGPWFTRTSAPVLLVGTRFDGVTDYQGAVASNGLLASSRLLTYAGWGHVAFVRSLCVTGHVVSYLLDGTLPPIGTVCPANLNPFLPAGPGPLALAPQRTAQRRKPIFGLPLRSEVRQRGF